PSRSPLLPYTTLFRSKRGRISLTMRLDQPLEARPTTARAEIPATGSEKRLRPADTRAGRNGSVPATGDAIAEAFRRAGLTGNTRSEEHTSELQSPDHL